MQGYDHGPVGSSSRSFYGGIIVCGKLGDTLAINDLQCGGSASEFSGCCLVISCVAGVNGLRQGCNFDWLGFRTFVLSAFDGCL